MYLGKCQLSLAKFSSAMIKHYHITLYIDIRTHVNKTNVTSRSRFTEKNVYYYNRKFNSCLQFQEVT